MNLYVYYKADPAHAHQLEASVTQMQAALGVPASLLRRPDTRDGLHTWMEFYPAVGQDFETQLTVAVQAAGLSQWIAGARHAEHFVEITSCA